MTTRARLFKTSGWLVALLVLLTTILLPALEIACLLYLLIPLWLGRLAPNTPMIFRLVLAIHPWSMMEILLLGILVTLVKLATDLWQTFNVPTKEAAAALLPLIKGTLNNIENIGIPQCLTGPIARGDTGTIMKHLDALEKISPTLLATYKELGRQTIPIAQAKSRINQQQVQELEALLK